MTWQALDQQIKLAESLKDHPLASLRETAKKHFAHQGFPDKKNEDWKYTSLAGLQDQSFNIQENTTLADDNFAEKLKPYIVSDICFVFLNGFYNPDLSLVPEELPITFHSLNNAVNDDSIINPAPYFPSPMASLNMTSALDGYQIQIDSAANIEPIIQILFVVDHQFAGKMQHLSNHIQIGANAHAQIVETYLGLCDESYWTNRVTNAEVAQNAQLQWTSIQLEGSQAFHTGSVSIIQQEQSKVESFELTLGASLSRSDLHFIQDAKGIETHTNGLYLLNATQHADHHTLVDHRYPEGHSYQLYKGIMDGSSRAVFNGKVKVHRDAQLVDAQQLNKNMLISNKARVDTKPQLEIDANDIKCAHGATIGQMQEDELFYLMTRGISRERARALMISGFADDVIQTHSNKTVQKHIHQLVKWRGESL